MDLTQLLDAQGEAAHQAWTKRWGESGLAQDYVNVNYEDSDPASIANPFRWNIMDKAQFLHPPEDGITHLRVVTSAQYVPQPRLLAGLIPSMSMHCAKMRHVSWEGLLTARSLSLLAENGPGLETVDLSAAYPVDAITLDALRSSLGHRVDRVQHMHLDLRWALDDRELEERVALDLVRSLRLFPTLRTLHLYVSVSPFCPTAPPSLSCSLSFPAGTTPTMALRLPCVMHWVKYPVCDASRSTAVSRSACPLSAVCGAWRAPARTWRSTRQTMTRTRPRPGPHRAKCALARFIHTSTPVTGTAAVGP